MDLPDNLVDPVLNTPTTQRVQVQYRLRVFSSQSTGVNPKTQPDGFSNVQVLAQGAQGSPVTNYPFVPADGSTVVVNGGKTSSAQNYGFQDSGLWVSGDGSSTAASDLGTVDGFVYAIPVAFVSRRNDASGSGGFDPYGNANGALPIGHVNNFSNGNLPGGPYLIPAGASDRPDGLFADIVAPIDVIDLRHHVAPVGLDLDSTLKSQLQVLMDKQLATWQVDAGDLGTIGGGSGDLSTYPMMCDEIGRTFGVGGNNTTSGNTTVGTTIRNFDHIARRFGAQSVVERVVFEILPTQGSSVPGITVTKSSGVNWHESDTITIDFSQLNPTTLLDWTTPASGMGGATFVAFAPPGTMVTDVLSVYHDDGYSVSPVNQQVQLTTVQGIGTAQVVLTLDPNPTSVDAGGAHQMVGDGTDNGSPRRIFVELELTYPTGSGLSRTPDLFVSPYPVGVGVTGYQPYDNGAPIIENDVTQRPPEIWGQGVSAPVHLPSPQFRSGYREVLLEQQSSPSGGSSPITDTLVTRTSSTVYTPRRVATATGLTANGGAATATYGSSQRLVTLGGGFLAPSQQAIVTVTYYSQDAIPNAGANGYQVGVYYRTNAPQTCGVQAGINATNGLLPVALTLEPLTISDFTWVGQSGKGSPDLCFPYASPMDQIAVAGFPSNGTEWYFSASADISIPGFDATTGFLTLQSLVQADGSNKFTLGSASSPTRGTNRDQEFRAYYDYVNNGGYKPTVMAMSLTGPVRHKVWVPMLARSTTDTLLFRRGEVLLVIFSRFADFDSNSVIAFTDIPEIRTAAAIYRTRNRLITPSM